MAGQAPPPPPGWDELRRRTTEAERVSEPVALAAPSPKLLRRKYTVVGPRSVYGLEPGATGVLALTPDQERDLIEAGHIALVANKPGHSPKPERE